MNLEVIKQVICDSIPDDVSVSNIDVKESGSGLTIKLTWEALKASAPDTNRRMPLEPLELKISETINAPGSLFRENLAKECKQYEEDLAKVKEAYRDKVGSEITDETTEYHNNLLKIVGEKVALFRNGEMICYLNVRFNPFLPYAVQTAWTGDSPILQNYDVLVVPKHYSVADVKQRNGFQSFSVIRVYGYATGSAKPKTSFEGKKFANISEVDSNSDAVYKKTVDEVAKPIAEEDDRSKTELEWTPIFKDVLSMMPREIKRYHDGFEGNFGYLLGAVIQRIAERNRDSKIDVKLATEILHKLLDAEKKPSNEYASNLIRAGIDPAQAYEWAKVKPPKKTLDGKIITSIDLKDPVKKEALFNNMRKIIDDQATVPSPKTSYEVNKIRSNYGDGIFRRTESDKLKEDGYNYNYSVSVLAQAQKIRDLISKGALKVEELPTMILNGVNPEAIKCWKELYSGSVYKLDGYEHIKPIDGYERPRFTKKAFEVVAEYKQACESYHKKFGGRPTYPIRGKRGVSDFSTSKKDVTDVEIMLLSNDRFTDPVLNPKKPQIKPVPPEIDLLAKPIEKDEIKKPGRFKKIFSHLKAIKDEILHG